MDTNDAYSILVIILSVTLAVFLVLAIIATSMAISFLRKVNRVADGTKRIVDNVESATESFKDLAGPAAFVKTIFSAFQARRK